MNILALDPGKTVGAAVLENGCCTHALESAPCEYATDIQHVVNMVAPYIDTINVIVIEDVVPYGSQMSVDVINTCKQIGALSQAFLLPIYYITRPEVKLHLLGRRTGTDSEIRAALVERYGPIGTKSCPGPLYGIKGHMFAALALATVLLDQLGGDAGLGKSLAKGLTRNLKRDA